MDLAVDGVKSKQFGVSFNQPNYLIYKFQLSQL